MIGIAQLSNLVVNGVSQIGNIYYNYPQLQTISNYGAGLDIYNNKTDDPDIRNYRIKSDIVAYGDFAIQKSIALGDKLNFNNLLYFQANTGIATFTNAVNIGNSVAAGVAIASTHKVSILIGGVQYYLLASNV